MGYLIVHVDDEPPVLELIKLICEIAEHQVISYINGSGLVEFIKKADDPVIEASAIPDVFILDVMLPDYDGYELARILRQSPRLGNIPILMLSAMAPALDIILEPNRSADNYLTKPIGPKELIQKITEAIQERKWRNTIT